MKKCLLVVCLVVLFSTVVMADSADECWPKDAVEGRGQFRVYGMAISSSATTLGFARTSNTSGCGTEAGLLGGSVERAFVAANFDPLARDIARGQGAYLDSLTALLGCRAELRVEFSTVAREAFPRLFPEQGGTPEDFSPALRRELARHPRLAGGCAHAA